ncbi:MAG: trimeric intracellular cation channel family protein [Burkholderiaceae bacterium]|nr:trimeric intracellular cation channel family protein [Burkholderiaceae bacterium]
MRTPEWWTLSTAQLAVEALAILAFALSGVIEGARKRLDVVGVSVVAGLAAFGGGTLRDVLLDRRPLFWIEHPGWLWGVLALGIAAMLLMRARHLAPTERAMQWPDAIGLALFNASGLQIALAAGLPALPAVLMGVVTATFGGVLRDIVCNEIPHAFSDHRPYAVCAFTGGWLGVAAAGAGMGEGGVLLLTAVSTLALRALAVVFDWRLPGWRDPGH